MKHKIIKLNYYADYQSHKVSINLCYINISIYFFEQYKDLSIIPDFLEKKYSKYNSYLHFNIFSF